VKAEFLALQAPHCKHAAALQQMPHPGQASAGLPYAVAVAGKHAGKVLQDGRVLQHRGASAGLQSQSSSCQIHAADAVPAQGQQTPSGNVLQRSICDNSGIMIMLRFISRASGEAPACRRYPVASWRPASAAASSFSASG